MITVWAECNGTLNKGNFEWSFGGRENDRAGYHDSAPTSSYTMTPPGGIFLRMGFIIGSHSYNDVSAEVKVKPNSLVKTSKTIRKEFDEQSATKYFSLSIKG